MPPSPFPLPLTLATDICSIPRIRRLLTQKNGIDFIRRVLRPEERIENKERCDAAYERWRKVEGLRGLRAWKGGSKMTIERKLGLVDVGKGGGGLEKGGEKGVNGTGESGIGGNGGNGGKQGGEEENGWGANGEGGLGIGEIRIRGEVIRGATDEVVRGHLERMIENERVEGERSLGVVAEFLAGRFAAKEAIVKAHQRHLTFHDIIIRRPSADKSGSKAPIAIVLPKSGVEKDGQEVKVSISHDSDYATAVCVAYTGESLSSLDPKPLTTNQDIRGSFIQDPFKLREAVEFVTRSGYAVDRTVRFDPADSVTAREPLRHALKAVRRLKRKRCNLIPEEENTLSICGYVECSSKSSALSTAIRFDNEPIRTLGGPVIVRTTYLGDTADLHAPQIKTEKSIVDVEQNKIQTSNINNEKSNSNRTSASPPAAAEPLSHALVGKPARFSNDRTIKIERLPPLISPEHWSVLRRNAVDLYLSPQADYAFVTYYNSYMAVLRGEEIYNDLRSDFKCTYLGGNINLKTALWGIYRENERKATIGLDSDGKFYRLKERVAAATGSALLPTFGQVEDDAVPDNRKPEHFPVHLTLSFKVERRRVVTHYELTQRFPRAIDIHIPPKSEIGFVTYNSAHMAIHDGAYNAFKRIMNNTYLGAAMDLEEIGRIIDNLQSARSIRGVDELDPKIKEVIDKALKLPTEASSISAVTQNETLPAFLQDPDLEEMDGAIRIAQVTHKLFRFADIVIHPERYDRSIIVRLEPSPVSRDDIERVRLSPLGGKVMRICRFVDATGTPRCYAHIFFRRSEDAADAAGLISLVTIKGKSVLKSWYLGERVNLPLFSKKEMAALVERRERLRYIHREHAPIDGDDVTTNTGVYANDSSEPGVEEESTEEKGINSHDPSPDSSESLNWYRPISEADEVVENENKGNKEDIPVEQDIPIEEEIVVKEDIPIEENIDPDTELEGLTKALKKARKRNQDPLTYKSLSLPQARWKFTVVAINFPRVTNEPAAHIQQIENHLHLRDAKDYFVITRDSEGTRLARTMVMFSFRDPDLAREAAKEFDRSVYEGGNVIRCKYLGLEDPGEVVKGEEPEVTKADNLLEGTGGDSTSEAKPTGTHEQSTEDEPDEVVKTKNTAGETSDDPASEAKPIGTHQQPTKDEEAHLPNSKEVEDTKQAPDPVKPETPLVRLGRHVTNLMDPQENRLARQISNFINPPDRNKLEQDSQPTTDEDQLEEERLVELRQRRKWGNYVSDAGNKIKGHNTDQEEGVRDELVRRMEERRDPKQSSSSRDE